MVVKRCSWGTCNADTRYPNRYPNVTFHPFAKPKRHLEKCLRWIKACGRPHDQLNVDNIRHWTYVCSRHFVDGMPTDKNPDPISANVYNSVTVNSRKRNSRKRKLPVKQSDPPPPKLSKRAATAELLELQNAHVFGGEDVESTNRDHDGDHLYAQHFVDGKPTAENPDPVCAHPGAGAARQTSGNAHHSDVVRLQLQLQAKWRNLSRKTKRKAESRAGNVRGTGNVRGLATTSSGKEREQKAASTTPSPASTPSPAPEKSTTPKTQPPSPTPRPAPEKYIVNSLHGGLATTSSGKEQEQKAASTTPKTLPPAPTPSPAPEKSTTPKTQPPAPIPSPVPEKYVVYSLREDLLNTLVNQDRKQEEASTTEVRLLQPGLKYVVYGVREEKGRKITWSKEVPENDVISVQKKVFTKEKVTTRRSQEKNVCCVPGCGQNRLKRIAVGKTFFSFPREESRCKQWVQSCGRQDWMEKSPVQICSQGFLICSDHFEDSQFQYSAGPTSQRLIPDAVPTLFKKRGRPSSKSSKPKKTQIRKSLHRQLQEKVSSLAQPEVAGEAQGSLTAPQNAEQMPEIEIDYAEDPTLHWTTLQSMTEVSPEGGGDGETATTVQSLTAAGHIKVEPMDTHTDTVPVNTPPPHTDSEPPDIKAEPQDIRTEPDIKAESQDISTEPDIKAEPQDVSTEPLHVPTVPLNMRPEPPDIKPEPVYFEEPWAGSGSTSHR